MFTLRELLLKRRPLSGSIRGSNCDVAQWLDVIPSFDRKLPATRLEACAIPADATILSAPRSTDSQRFVERSVIAIEMQAATCSALR